MSSEPRDPRPDVEAKDAARLERARVAAEQFCRHFRYSEDQIEKLSGPPLRPPLVIEREGDLVEVYRWLGHGRGQSYVQVEIELGREALTVYGSRKDREFGPWQPPE